MAEPTLADDMKFLAEQAVGLARDQHGISLDYSEDSLEQVETILAAIYDAIPKGAFAKVFKRRPSEAEIQQMAVVWGAYVGEVIRRRWGGEWTLETPVHPEPVLTLRVIENNIFPPARVYKRLTNGPEDNVWHYYQVLRGDFGGVRLKRLDI